MVKELITKADEIIAEVRGETGGGSNAKIAKSKNNLATFLQLHKGEHEKTSAQLDAILNVLKKDNKLEKKEAEADRKERERQKREKREKLIESLKSGVGAAASAGKKVVGTLVAPFRDVWEKIADFLKVTVIGALFNKALNWFGEKENQEKIERIGRFLKFWWPSLLAGYALFFTPIGGFVAGAVGILTTALPTLAKILASPLFLKLAGLGLLGGVILKGAVEGEQRKKKIRKDFNETNDESITTVDEFQEENKNIKDPTKKKSSMSWLQGILELGSTPGAMPFNEGGTVAGSGKEDSVPAMLTPGEVVIPAGTGNISKTPIIAPKVKGVSGGNSGDITPPSTVKISNSVVLPPIRKEKSRQQVREGSTIPTFEISSNASSRQTTLMAMGIEGMV